MKNSISEIKKKTAPILKNYDVKRAAVFGSWARGEEKKKSDIDILIEFRKDDKSLLDLVGLKLALEEKLKRKVDVLTYDSLHPLLKDRILEEQKAIL
jgi:predicted nucleotidyltransferase